MDMYPDYITQLREYFRAGDTQQFPKGKILASENELSHVTHYVSSGYVRVYTANNRGDQYTHVIYGPGDIFPLTTLTTQKAYGTYETMTDTRVYCRGHDTLVDDLVHIDGLAFGMMQQAIEQYRIFTMRVDNLEYKYASERLAYRLVMLATRFGERSGKSITIVPPMTHVILGSSLNLSRESVSREMEKLIRKELIRYNSAHQIVIPDIQALSDYTRVPSEEGLH